MHNVLGVDIGIAPCGWGIVEVGDGIGKIVATGVRCFDPITSAKIEERSLLRDSRDIINRLLRDGFKQVSVRGSHYKFIHPATHHHVIVPHPKRDLPIGTVRSIYRRAGWPKD